MKSFFPILPAIAVVGLFSSASAQSLYYCIEGEVSFDRLGQSMAQAAVGDVNLDGYADILAGATSWDIPDPDGTGPLLKTSNVGRAYVYSGYDGTVLYAFDGENASDTLGWSVSGAGDLNGDGNPDIVVGAYLWDSIPNPGPDGTNNSGDESLSNGKVYFYSGKDGSLIHSIAGGAANDRLGYSVSGGGSMDTDTTPDVVVGAYNASTAYVFSGVDIVAGTASVTTTSYTFTKPAGDEHGRAVAYAGDVNGDTYGDVLVGTPREDTVTFADNGAISVYSGKDGSEIYNIKGKDLKKHRFGWAVSAAQDIDLDGYADFMAAEGNVTSPSSNAGEVQVFSGKDMSVMGTFTGIQLENLGGSLAGVGDVDADGFPDVAAGAPSWAKVANPGPDGTNNTGDEIEANGRVYVYSGQFMANGFGSSVLYTFDGENGGVPGPFGASGDDLGTAVGGLGDINGDGQDDFGASARRWDTPASDNGKVYAYSGASLSLTADTHLLSVGVANSQTMTIDAGVGNALGDYWLFTGFAASGDTPGVTMAPGVVIPLNQPDPLTSFVIGLTQLGGGAPTFTGWRSTLDGAGKASPSLNTFGPTPAPIGVTLHHAALVYTSNGCGAGCDTFQLATNWVPMTTTP